MISNAGYFVLNKVFLKDLGFDPEMHGSRVGFSLFSYGMGKHDFDYDSEIEYVDDGIKDLKPLNRRKVQEAGEPKKKMVKGM